MAKQENHLQNLACSLLSNWCLKLPIIPIVEIIWIRGFDCAHSSRRSRRSRCIGSHRQARLKVKDEEFAKKSKTKNYSMKLNYALIPYWSLVSEMNVEQREQRCKVLGGKKILPLRSISLSLRINLHNPVLI